MSVESIAKVLNKAQMGRAGFDKYIRILKRTFEKVKFEVFFEEYTTVLLNLLVTDTKIKNVFVQRSLEFMAKFACSFCINDDVHIFFERLVQDTLKYHKASDPNVRYRVCEFIKLLLCNIGYEANLDDDLCDEISLVMQERMNDIKPNVRLQAVMASQRLQDPDNKDDPVINSYIKVLVTEASPLIRKTVIECIAVCMKTLVVLLERCLDTNDIVRLTVFNKLSKLPVKFLKIEQRQFVLRNGLRSDPKVAQIVQGTLLPKWLTKYDGNCLEFLKALKLDATEQDFKQTIELLEKILSCYFKSIPASELQGVLNLNESKIPQDMNFESSVYWRCLVEYFDANNNEFGDLLELVMPDLMCLVEYIDNYYKNIKEINSEWEKLQKNYIINQLLQIVLKYEILDTSERLRTHDFITNLLTDANLYYPNILLLTKIFENMEPDIEIRIQGICTIISAIKDPLVSSETVEPSQDDLQKRDLRIAPLRVRLNILREDMDSAILRQEFQQADQMKNEIMSIETQMENIRKEYQSQTIFTKTPKNDNQTTLNCMDVLIAFLSSPKINKLTTALRSIMDTFVKPNLLTISALTNDFKCLKCYGLFCIIDKKEATSSIQIFCQHLLVYKHQGTYNPAGIIISSSIVTDLLLCYGTIIFGEADNYECETTKKTNKKSLYDNTRMDDSLPDPTSNASLRDIIEIFSDMLDDPNPELREIGGGCLIKLLFHNIIKTSNVLSKLIIKWFNPATEKDVKLRQMLGIFFSSYVLRVPGSLMMMEKAFIPTLNVVINAPQNSPLIDIDIDSLLKFFVNITRSHQQNCDQGLEVHKNIAVELCNEICNKPQSSCVPIYIRTLTYLDVPNDDPVILEDLKKQANNIFNVLNEKQKQLKKLVEKYLTKLNTVIFDPGDQNDPNQITEDILTDQISNLSVSSGKRKRDLSKSSENPDENDNLSEREEIPTEENSDESATNVIENILEEGTVVEEETEEVPRRSLRRSCKTSKK